MAAVASDGLGIGSGDASAQAKVSADQQQMETDLKRVDHEADLVAAGK
jgi:hypothetical protein